ncbi:interleukin-8 [Brachyhypopomus gauderio]|uniref:interleukin-8 n=1 Tax=Brachyhypopomus gauderio TaxID=698409 RepID=UPI004042389D
MNCRIMFLAVFLAFFTLSEGMSLRGLGVEPRCRCSGTESRRIGKLIESIELFPPNPHCRDTEIIATLKNSKQEICLDITAPWVMKIIEKMMANKAP